MENMEREKTISREVVRNGSTVRVFCKGVFVFKECLTEVHAMALQMRLKRIDEEQQLYEATSDWILEDE